MEKKVGRIPRGPRKGSGIDFGLERTACIINNGGDWSEYP